MTRRLSPWLLALAALALASPAASAAVPSPAHSTVDPCLRICPGGDLLYHIVVRDLSNVPIAASSVQVSFCDCFSVVLCPLLGSEPYTVVGGCNVVMITNAAGVVDIPIRGGGLCVGGPIRVFADGVLLAQLGVVASTDQNGDLAVDVVDHALVAAKITGPYDASADLNCSGALESGDLAVLDAHLGHTCAAVVPTLPGTWGRLKTIYR